MIGLMSDDAQEPPGDTLRDRLRACQQEGLPGIPVAELLGYTRDIADALDDLHAQGRAQRNVEPDSIRVIDGHARLTDPAPPPRPGEAAVVGTPAYMAPEVWGGKTDARSDQYSLACSYAELRLGRPPFAGQNLVAVMQAHLDGTPELTLLPSAERRALLRGLAKDAALRYPTCRRLAEELEEAVASGQ
jgi:serine/threonine protein kinase